MNNLLWTGGWDSTFRLLQLLLIKKQIVQPYYIIDENRKSTSKEIETIRKIKEALFKKYPQTKKLIKPTIYFGKSDLEPNQKIFDQYENLRKKQFFGTQYIWLAQFANQLKINGLELSIHKDDKAKKIIEKNVIKKISKSGNYYCLKNNPKKPNLKLFKNFRFPLFNLTKVDMRNTAKEHGFLNLMRMTWFCHKPTKSGKPCGVCGPCQYAMQEGMQKRLPKVSRLKYHKNKIKNKIKK